MLVLPVQLHGARGGSRAVGRRCNRCRVVRLVPRSFDFLLRPTLPGLVNIAGRRSAGVTTSHEPQSDEIGFHLAIVADFGRESRWRGAVTPSRGRIAFRGRRHTWPTAWATLPNEPRA